MARGTSVERPEVILFARTLSRRVSGGTRAVLHRANLFAELGYPVSLLVTGISSDIEVAGLRASGLLHSGVRVLHFWSDGPDWDARLAAADHELVDVPRPFEGDPAAVRTVAVTGQLRTITTTVDGVVRSVEATDPDGSTARSFRLFDANGACTQLWRFANGRVALVDELVNELPVLRRYYVDGRYCWLTAETDLQSGTGRAEYADGRVTDYAGAVAEWVDREFADREEIVVFADGENVWQRVLRLLTHPGACGVSVLHNSHLAAPYDSDAATKPAWQSYFTDTRNVDVMVCLTGQQQADLGSRYPGLPLRVVHHAVPKPHRVRDERPRRNVIFLGRLAEQKRLDDLASVFARVVAAVPDAVLDVYGNGPEQESFRSALQERGLIDHVVLHGHTTDPLGAFAAARVAIMTSWYEGLPLTLTEAMSVGTPWVAYDLNYGPSEVIRSSVDGFLVPAGDVEACARGVIRLLTDDDLAKRMSVAAREVTARFSRDRYRREWLDVLEDARRNRARFALAAGDRAVDHAGDGADDHETVRTA